MDNITSANAYLLYTSRLRRGTRSGYLLGRYNIKPVILKRYTLYIRVIGLKIIGKDNSKIKILNRLLSSSRRVIVLVIKSFIPREPSNPVSCKEIRTPIQSLEFLTERRNLPRMYVTAIARGFGKLPGADAASSQKTMTCKRLNGVPVSYAELMIP